MEEESNCQLATTYSFSSVGSFGFKMKIDGNVTYIPDFYVLGQQIFEETYIKVTDDYQYVYTKDMYGDWTREKSERLRVKKTPTGRNQTLFLKTPRTS